jgi:hypothetical protein
MHIVKSTYKILYKIDQDNYWSQATILACNSKDAVDKFTKGHQSAFPFKQITSIKIEQY